MKSLHWSAKLGAVVVGTTLSLTAFGSRRVDPGLSSPRGTGGEATSNIPSFRIGSAPSGQPSEHTIEVRATVVDVRAGTMFLNVGGPVVRAELGGTELRRTPSSGDEVVVHLERGATSIENRVTGLWAVK
jgi:hypothetical protein